MSESYQAEHTGRSREEDELRQLGRSLRRVIPPRRWKRLSEARRKAALRKAHSIVHRRMRIAHATTLAFSDADERGYEETTGEIKIPRLDLAAEAHQLVGLLVHEVRHAWQWDVIQGRTSPPGAERTRTMLAAAYAAYDAEDRFRYANNELEQDANDRAAYALEGYKDGRLLTRLRTLVGRSI